MTDDCCGGGHSQQAHQLNYQAKNTTESDKPSKQLFAAANYLRNQKISNLKPRTGVLNGKRVEYFKGKSAYNALLREEYAKSGGPPVTDRSEAEKLLEQLLMHQFFLRCDRGDAHPAGGRALQPDPLQMLDEDSYYTWLYQGSQVGTMLGGIALVAIVFAGVMFPLWPQFMRDGAWYLSMVILGLLGLLLAITVVRLIFYLLTVVLVKPGIWIFPNLYEDVGFIDSFIPLWAWAESAKKQGKRPAASGAAAANATGESAKGKSTATAPLLEEITDPVESSGVAAVEEDEEDVEELIADRKDN
ncbi:translocation protein Sec62-domain-containing protein [Syncephalis plumigaleata]|nr:translocation protein Sec62-domain-containing protein [Syncephalis plumigaleata]